MRGGALDPQLIKYIDYLNIQIELYSNSLAVITSELDSHFPRNICTGFYNPIKEKLESIKKMPIDTMRHNINKYINIYNEADNYLNFLMYDTVGIRIIMEFTFDILLEENENIVNAIRLLIELKQSIFTISDIMTFAIYRNLEYLDKLIKQRITTIHNGHLSYTRPNLTYVYTAYLKYGGTSYDSDYVSVSDSDFKGTHKELLTQFEKNKIEYSSINVLSKNLLQMLSTILAYIRKKQYIDKKNALTIKIKRIL